MFGAWGLGFRLAFQTLGFTASLLSSLSPISPLQVRLVICVLAFRVLLEYADLCVGYNSRVPFWFKPHMSHNLNP